MPKSLVALSKLCFGLTAFLCSALWFDPSTGLAQQESAANSLSNFNATASMSFQKTALPFLSQFCVQCHDEENRESGIRVDQLDGSLAENSLKLWEQISKQIETGSMPPEEEKQPSAPQREQILEWIEVALHEARSRTQPVHGSVRRLTVQQYRNALRELLDLDEDVAATLPPDGVSRDGFTNDAGTLLTSPLQVEAWFSIAEKAIAASLVDASTPPVIQNFRMDLGESINPHPFPEKLILGANSHLLPNKDFIVTELEANKPFAFKPYRMQTNYRFNEGYQGNNTVRGWREYNSIYHAVFACMRGDRGYPKGNPYKMVKTGLLLRPSIPTSEIFGESSTYGPKANFKIALRELPESGRFRVRVKAAKYQDGLLLTGRGIGPSSVSDKKALMHDQIQHLINDENSILQVEKAGIYQVDVHPKSYRSKIDAIANASKLNEGLIGHWSFNREHPGHSESEKLAGELVGGAKTGNSPIGRNSKSLVLDGATAAVVVPRTDEMNVGAGDFTVSAWINPTELRQGGIVCLGRYNWTHGWYFDMPNNRGVLRIETVSPENKNNGSISSPAGVIQVNHWQHVAAVVRRETNQTQLYVNGYLVASGSIAPANLDNPSVDLHIGRIQDAKLFKGQIDEVRIYRRALEPAELQALIKPGEQFATPPPPIGPKQLELKLANRVFASGLKQGESAFLAVRIPAGEHPVKVSAGNDTALLHQLVFTRLSPESDLAKQFLIFENRNPQLAVYMGLRRDCGHTCQQIEQPRAVANTDFEDYLFEGAINNYPRPFVEKNNDNYLAGVREITVRSEYTDGRDLPRLLIGSIEFEGPLYDSWPPASHRKIFIPSKHQNDPAKYATEIIANFATRAFRRPVTESELASLLQTWKGFYEADQDFQKSVQDTLVVVLTSPPFLFIVEQSTGPHPEDLNEIELASKLSFFLWNGPPDEHLLNRAESGKLKQNLEAEVARLVTDSRFRKFADQFAEQWLSLNQFDVVETNRKKYPRLTMTAKRHLRQEPARFIEHLVRQNLPVRNLIQSNILVVNEVVANYYGLEKQVESGFKFVPVVHEQPHLGGILSHAAVLAGLSDGNEANPVKRGAWFARKIIAEPPADPPPNVPDLKDDRKLSLRARLQQHRSVKNCVKCHEGIDPWGLAFEQYDASGLFINERVDATSRLPDGQTVKNLQELRRHLVNDRMDDVAYSVAHHLSIYAIGRRLSYNEQRRLRQECVELEMRDYGMLDLIQHIVASDLFLKK